jgi:hypothetical protein
MGRLFLIKGANGKKTWVNENFNTDSTLLFILNNEKPSYFSDGFAYMMYADIKELFNEDLIWDLKYSHLLERYENIVVYQNKQVKQETLNFLLKISSEMNKNIYLTIPLHSVTIEQYDDTWRFLQ